MGSSTKHCTEAACHAGSLTADSIVSGTIHAEGTIPATRFDLDRWMKTLPQPWTAAMEATVFTVWIYDHLQPHAAALKMAHPPLVVIGDAPNHNSLCGILFRLGILDPARSSPFSKFMDQHTIPNCYLKAWCDPAPLPEKHTPFIWLISKDGRDKRRRAPHNAFTESHRYTIRRDNGEKVLTVEQRTLGATEDAFVLIRPRLEARETLTPRERFDLCAFATAMFARSKGQGDHFAEQFRAIHKQVENLEKRRGAKPGLSLETRLHAENAAASTIAMFMLSWPQLFMRMNITILITDADEGFITSDRPFIMTNPDAYKLPPIMRTPAPGRDAKIEVTLPLTPKSLLLISHIYPEGYIEVPQATVDELNTRVRFGCEERFVSQKGIVKDSWFIPAKEPEDSWEKSPEGIASEKLRQRDLKAKAEWEASVTESRD